mmetsp:Transcript_149926/g.481730  ORF Transcript_149926/g.481730 Transcript_149926/m.481730 type:complete len:304 (-) Transcript_149926:622-1533(-)
MLVRRSAHGRTSIGHRPVLFSEVRLAWPGLAQHRASAQREDRYEDTEDQRKEHWRDQHHEVHCHRGHGEDPPKGLDFDVHHGIPGHGGEGSEEKRNVDGRASASLAQLRPVVPLDPMLASALQEECEHCPQILAERPSLKLVRVENEGREQPRPNRQAQGEEDPSQLALRHRSAGRPCEHDEERARAEHGAVVVRDGRVVEVEAANLAELQAAARRLAHEGPALRGQAPAGAHVGGAAVSELVDHVVADDLALKDEQQRRECAHLLDESQHGDLEAALHPDFYEERQGGGHQEEEEQPRKPNA